MHMHMHNITLLPVHVHPPQALLEIDNREPSDVNWWEATAVAIGSRSAWQCRKEYKKLKQCTTYKDGAHGFQVHDRSSIKSVTGDIVSSVSSFVGNTRDNSCCVGMMEEVMECSGSVLPRCESRGHDITCVDEGEHTPVVDNEVVASVALGVELVSASNPVGAFVETALSNESVDTQKGNKRPPSSNTSETRLTRSRERKRHDNKVSSETAKRPMTRSGAKLKQQQSDWPGNEFINAMFATTLCS
jgi:hypothetical protein